MLKPKLYQKRCGGQKKVIMMPIRVLNVMTVAAIEAAMKMKDWIY